MSFFGLLCGENELEEGSLGNHSYVVTMTKIVDSVLNDGYAHGMPLLSDEERQQVVSKIVFDHEIKGLSLEFIMQRAALKEHYDNLVFSMEKAAAVKNKSIVSFVVSTSLLNLYFNNWLVTNTSMKLFFKNALVVSSLLSSIIVFLSNAFEARAKEERDNFSENNKFLAVQEYETKINDLLMKKIVNFVNEVVQAR